MFIGNNWEKCIKGGGKIERKGINLVYVIINVNFWYDWILRILISIK